MHDCFGPSASGSKTRAEECKDLCGDKHVKTFTIGGTPGCECGP